MCAKLLDYSDGAADDNLMTAANDQDRIKSLGHRAVEHGLALTFRDTPPVYYLFEVDGGNQVAMKRSLDDIERYLLEDTGESMDA